MSSQLVSPIHIQVQRPQKVNLHTLRSRGSTLRSRTRPLGRKDSGAVRDGNVLAARALVLCILAAAKGCFWLLEQPASSIMELHPLFQAAIRLLGMHRLCIAMGRYGAPTPKRTILYSSPCSVFQPRFCLFKFTYFQHWPPKLSIYLSIYLARFNVRFKAMPV